MDLEEYLEKERKDYEFWQKAQFLIDLAIYTMVIVSVMLSILW